MRDEFRAADDVRRPHWREGATRLHLATLLLASAGSLYVFAHYLTDDAFITLRYAEHLASGQGLVWNAGEPPVEGYTNFLQVVVAAAAISASVPPLDVLRALNMASLVACVVIVYLFARRLVARASLAWLAALLLALHAPLAYWCASGLETALFACFGVLSVHLVTSLNPRARRLTWIPLLLLSLTRFEGPLFFLVMLGVCGGFSVAAGGTIRERFTRLLGQHGTWISLFVLSYGAYFLFRLSYFGHLLPNSVYYKAGARYHSGHALLTEFWRSQWPYLAALLLVPWRRLGALAALPGGLIAAYAVMLYDVFPSVSYHHRFFLPVVPFVLVLAAAALERVSRWLPRRRSTVIVVIGFVASVWWTTVGSPTQIDTVYQLSLPMLERMRARLRTADYLGAHLTPEATVAIGDSGLVGYLLPNRMLDIFGLNSVDFTHTHRKDVAAYLRSLMEGRPDAVVLVSNHPLKFQGVWPHDKLVYSEQFQGSYREVWSVPNEQRGYYYRIFFRHDTAHLRNASSSYDPNLPLTVALEQVKHSLRSTNP